MVLFFLGWIQDAKFTAREREDTVNNLRSSHQQMRELAMKSNVPGFEPKYTQQMQRWTKMQSRLRALENQRNVSIIHVFCRALFDSILDRSIDWLIASALVIDESIDHSIDWLNGSIIRLIGWMDECSTDWLIDWLTDRKFLMSWLIIVRVFRVFLHKHQVFFLPKKFQSSWNSTG